jgi:hypothetical protein
MSKLAPPNVTVTRITRSGPARALDDCTGYEGQHTTFATTKALCCQTLRARNDPVASSEIGAGGRIRLVCTCSRDLARSRSHRAARGVAFNSAALFLYLFVAGSSLSPCSRPPHPAPRPAPRHSPAKIYSKHPMAGSSGGTRRQKRGRWPSAPAHGWCPPCSWCTPSSAPPCPGGTSRAHPP